MKRHPLDAAGPFAIVMALALTAVLGAAERDVTPAADPRLSDDERTEIVMLLEATQRDLLERAAGLSDEAFNFKPAPDRWSIAQILEHLVIVERDFLDGADKAMATAINPEWASDTTGQTDKLYRLVPNRVRRFQAPESMQPTGEMSRKQLLRSYEELRARSIAMISDSDAPLKAHTTDHPLLGRLGAHHWILFAGLHNLRHNQQAVEVMADPGFPH